MALRLKGEDSGLSEEWGIGQNWKRELAQLSVRFATEVPCSDAVELGGQQFSGDASDCQYAK